MLLLLLLLAPLPIHSGVLPLLLWLFLPTFSTASSIRITIMLLAATQGQLCIGGQPACRRAPPTRLQAAVLLLARREALAVAIALALLARLLYAVSPCDCIRTGRWERRDSVNEKAA